MKRTTRRPQKLRFSMPDGSTLATSQDVAYAWVTLQGHTGWSRIRSGAEHQDTVRILIPKNYSRSLTEATLFASPEELQAELPAGVALLLPDQPHWTATLLQKVQAAVKDRRLLDLYRQCPVEQAPFLLARMRTSDVLALSGELGPQVLGAALTLRSTAAREYLLKAMGTQRVSQMLMTCDLPDTIRWQVYRSPAFEPVDLSDPRLLRAAAGNPNLSDAQQVAIVSDVLEDVTEVDPAVYEPTLTRLLRSTGLSQSAALALLPHLDKLPRKSLLALAGNPHAMWPLVREALDRFPDREVALTSIQTGPLTPAREAAATETRDPVMMNFLKVHQPGPVTLPSESELLELSRRLLTGECAEQWSFESVLVPKDEWGVQAVARRWQAAADVHPQAEAALRRVMDLHNRAWGEVTPGAEDPRRQLLTATARSAGRFDPVLPVLDLPVGESQTLESVRQAAVLAIARDFDLYGPDKTYGPIELRAIQDAVLWALAAEMSSAAMALEPAVA